MADLPQEGKFKISSVGPIKTGTSKKTGKPYKIYSLQFEGDNTWYDTYWGSEEEPKVGQELDGKKEYDEKFESYKFNMSFGGGTKNWNPAGAQATVVLASIELVNGFLAVPEFRQLWVENKPELKATFDKYVETVKAVTPRVKEMAIGLGAMGAETKTATESSQKPVPNTPSAPPDFDGFPEGEEPVNV